MQPGLAVLGARGNGRLRFGAVGVAVFRKAGFFAERFLVFSGTLLLPTLFACEKAAQVKLAHLRFERCALLCFRRGLLLPMFFTGAGQAT